MLKARRRRTNRFEGDDVNPMDAVSNLSDVMLILAVGIMLALIMHGQITMNTTDSAEDTNQTDQTVTFSDSDLQNKEEIPENVQRMGDVFYDAETGMYYIVGNGETAGE